ncbi:MAG: hypothetical protein WCC91_09850 [Bradyrhizobium sp.]
MLGIGILMWIKKPKRQIGIAKEGSQEREGRCQNFEQQQDRWPRNRSGSQHRFLETGSGPAIEILRDHGARETARCQGRSRRLHFRAISGQADVYSLKLLECVGDRYTDLIDEVRIALNLWKIVDVSVSRRSTAASLRMLRLDAFGLHEIGFRLRWLHGSRRRTHARTVPLILPPVLERIALMNDRSGNGRGEFAGLCNDACRRRKQGGHENGRDLEMISHIAEPSVPGTTAVPMFVASAGFES